MSLITRSTYSRGRWHVIAVALIDGFFLNQVFLASTQRALSRLASQLTSFQLLVSSLTHALTRYRSEGRSETHRFAGVALSTTLCKLGVQHPFVDQQEKDVCVSGQL